VNTVRSVIRYPGSGATAITILLASLFIVGGIFRTVAATAMQFPNWGWTAFSGIVSLILGFTLIYQLPTASVWFIEFLVGVRRPHHARRRCKEGAGGA